MGNDILLEDFPDDTLLNLSLEQIVTNPKQPRKNFPEKSFFLPPAKNEKWKMKKKKRIFENNSFFRIFLFAFLGDFLIIKNPGKRFF